MLILACAIAFSGCGGAGQGPSEEAGLRSLVSQDEVRLIAAPRGTLFTDPVWLPALAKIVFTRSPPPGDAFRKRLASVAVDGSDLKRLPLPNEAGCKYTSKVLPTVLGDGRLGYVQQCWPGGGRVVTLMTWDPGTNIVRPLVPYRLLFLQGPFACSPDLSSCVINDRNGLYEQLAWLGTHGLQPIELPIERAGFPSWSPDGRWIALDGVPEGTEATGIDRLGLPRDVYLVSSDLERLRPLVRGAINLTKAAWSSDGQWLALSLKPMNGVEGLYLVEVATGKLVLVLEGSQFGAPTWLPGDGSLAVPIGTGSRFSQEQSDVGLYIVRLPDEASFS
jgi:hypothetical protein